MKQTEEKPLLLTKPKRPYKARVRTGCITCKIRRVKCDETRPACLQCSSTGRTCDGYAPPRALIFEVSKDERERRSFHYFRECTAPELRGGSCARFWDGFVLRASYFQEGLRHAIAAIGALHESLELQTGQQALAIRGFAFEQYSKAIVALTRRDQIHTTEDVLTACILFTWFENLQGNFDIALSHLKSGLNILDTWRTNLNPRLRQSAVTATALINDDLAPTLESLKVQATIFLRSPDQPNPVIHDSSLPEVFSNIAEAHRYFYQLIHWTCHSLRIKTNLRSQVYVQAEHVPQILRKLDQWSALLGQYMHDRFTEAEAETPADRYWRVKSALHLQIQYQNAMIMLKALPYDRETRFDDQLVHFKSIVTLGREFLDEGDRVGANLRHTVKFGSFDHDHSIIPSLFLTACRCRDPHVRRHAISLLRRYYWREDIWDSEISASLAEHLMLLEEMGLGDVMSCEDVPDSSRLYMVACTFYVYNRADENLELRYEIFDPNWATIGAKLHCLRSGKDIVEDGFEDFWWSYPGSFAPLNPEDVISRDVGHGIFPQLAGSNARLWTTLNRGNAVRCVGRFGSPSIFRAHSKKTGIRGDMITVIGQLTEYMSTDRPWVER